jgi:predicted ester cyclase
MSAIDRKAVVRRFFELAINQRDESVFDELIAPDFVLHSSMLGEVRGAAAFKQSALALVKPCPDLQVPVEDVLEGEHDTIVARVTYRGTDTGGLVPGVPATGKPFEFTAICTCGACWTAVWPNSGRKPIGSASSRRWACSPAEAQDARHATARAKAAQGPPRCW